MIMKAEEVIKKVDGKYFVFSEDGKKKLGGPYDTRKDAVKRLKQIENFKNSESISWKPTFDFEESDKWLKISGTALTVGVSKNGRNYNYENLESNNGKMFNIIAGHRDDYDNPDHVVGEGTYIFDGQTLKYEARIKNTAQHPDIIDQTRDGLLAPSIQGNFDADVSENGDIDVHNLDIPLMALVSKHARGVEGANIETALAERLELGGIEKTEEKLEVSKMAEEETKDEVSEAQKKIDELMEANRKLEESNKAFKEKFEAVEKQEEAKALEAKKKLVESIVKLNSKFETDKLMEKSEAELQTIMEYEEKLRKESVSEVADDKNEDPLKGIVVEEKTKDITMTEERRQKFNQDLMNSIYR